MLKILPLLNLDIFICVEVPVILLTALAAVHWRCQKGQDEIDVSQFLHSQEGIVRVFSIYEAGRKKCQSAWHVAWILFIMVCSFTIASSRNKISGENKGTAHGACQLSALSKLCGTRKCEEGYSQIS